MGQDSYFSSDEITKSGFMTRGREKICLLMHDISAILTLLFFLSLISLFPFLSSFSFNFLFKLPTSLSFLPLMGTVPIYITNQAYVISLF